MTLSRSLCALGAAAALLSVVAACGGSSGASKGSAGPEPSPGATASPAPTPVSPQAAIDALPDQVRAVATACQTALVPEIAVAEGGGTVITPSSCTTLSTPIYQDATILAEQQYYEQQHPAQH
ncbi:MAG TPA: hypothetical protein VHU88_03760 [Sporichthyaceae bacterium]|nr:hypothetical protein [Sporichthyaceae bacterium]